MADTVPPPRFSRQIAAEDRLCLVSATSNGITLGAGKAIGAELAGFDSGALIFTENLNLYAAASGHGRHTPAFSVGKKPFIVSATNVDISPEMTSDRALAFLTADGIEGIPQTTDAVDDKQTRATNGQDAGEINVFIANLGPDTAKQLTIKAVGGAGASNAQLDTPAGTGGRGGRVRLHALTSTHRIASMISAFETKYMPRVWTEANKARLKLISSKSAIFVDITKLIEDAMQYCVGTPYETLQFIREPLQEILNSLGTEDITLWTIAHACIRSHNRIKKVSSETAKYLYGNISVKGGAGGEAKFRGPLARGIVGEDGQPGEKSVVLDDKSVSASAFPYIHPLQCRMVLEKAESYFYFDDELSRAEALRLVSELLLKLETVPASADPRTDSQQWKNLENSLEKWRNILEISKDASIRSTFQAIKTEASRLYQQLTATSVDMYGHSKDWVPRMSLKRIEEETDSALDHLKQIEDTSENYRKALADAVDREQKIADQASALTYTAKAMQSDTLELRSRLDELYISIQDTKTAQAIEDARKEASTELMRLRKEIHDELKLSPGSILKSCEMVAFSVENVPMLASQGANLAHEALTSVPDDTDVPVKKDVIIDKVKKADASLEGVWNASDLEENADGTFKSTSTEVKKLVLDESSMDKMLGDFSQTSFAAQAETAQTKLEAFIKLVSARNKNIIDYNFTVRKALDQVKAKKQLQAQKKTLDKQKFLHGAIPLDEFQSALTLMESLHQASRTRAMRLISTMQRAVRFATLVDATTLIEQLTLPTDAELEMTHAQLDQRKAVLSGKVFELVEGQGSIATPFPGRPEGSGKIVHLSDEQLSELLSTHKVQVEISPIYANSKTHSQFRGSADIRIWKVHCWLRGLKIKETFPVDNDEPPLVSIRISHGPQSTIVSPNDDEYRFEHAEIPVTFSYTLNARGVTKIGDTGAMVIETTGDPKLDNTYAAPGLFTTWEISLKNIDTDAFDLESVTGCSLEFYGTARAFSKEATTDVEGLNRRLPRRVGGRQGDASAEHFYQI